MSFIKVTANTCNADGQSGGQQIPVELELSIDLIGAFRGSTVLLKGGHIVRLGENYWTNFRLAQGEKIPKP